MKKFQIISKVIFLLFTSYCLLPTATAQSPEKMSYQAVIRDAGNHLVTTQIGMRISILQGSESGTVKYVETQTPIPNENGLVTIEIGGGSVVSGTFAGIDWSDGPYFIMTETDIDPAGGLTGYTITGTSQLLSVPYALYANTVASYPETDPEYTGSQAANITASDISKLNNLSGTNTGDQTLSDLGGVAGNEAISGETKTKITYDAKGLVRAGTDATTADIAASTNKNYVTDEQLTVIGNTSGTNTGDNAVNTNYSGLVNYTHPTSDGNLHVPATSTTNSGKVLTAGAAAGVLSWQTPNIHYPGELYQGGVVFWVDNTGNHGLICSMIDNSTFIIWTSAAFQSNTVPNGALSDWNGQANTTAIVTQAGAGITYAAGLCDAYTNADYGTGVYSDWYLPTIDDLNLLYNAKRFVNKALDSDGNAATTAIAKTYYWSSSEYNSNTAWAFNFFLGYPSGTYSKANTNFVRAIRAF